MRTGAEPGPTAKKHHSTVTASQVCLAAASRRCCRADGGFASQAWPWELHICRKSYLHKGFKGSLIGLPTACAELLCCCVC